MWFYKIVAWFLSLFRKTPEDVGSSTLSVYGMKQFMKKIIIGNNVIRYPAYPTVGGWGNGYLAVPKSHPWYGLDYDKIDAEVHGGLTFAGNYIASAVYEDYWLLGFDTFHFGDREDLDGNYLAEQLDSLFDQALHAYAEHLGTPIEENVKSLPESSEEVVDVEFKELKDE